MPGTKGMKWTKARAPKRIQCSVALRPHLYHDVAQLCKEKRWSTSTAIEYIVEQYYKYKYYQEKQKGD